MLGKSATISGQAWGVAWKQFRDAETKRADPDEVEGVLSGLLEVIVCKASAKNNVHIIVAQYCVSFEADS